MAMRRFPDIDITVEAHYNKVLEVVTKKRKEVS